MGRIYKGVEIQPAVYDRNKCVLFWVEITSTEARTAQKNSQEYFMDNEQLADLAEAINSRSEV